MKNLLLKLRLIYWPFLRLLLLVAGGYAGLAWLLQLVTGTVFDTSFASQYWKVLTIGSVAIVVALRPRIHLLQIGKNERLRQLFYLTALATFAIAAGSAADALIEGSRQLVQLDSIDELPRYHGNQAYVVGQLYVAHAQLTSDKAYDDVKGGTMLTLALAAPLLRAAADTGHSSGAFAWLGAEYKTTEKGRTTEEIYSRFSDFTVNARAEFQHEGYSYLVRAGSTPGLLAAVRHHPAAATRATDPVILLARREPFSQRGLMPLMLLKTTILFGVGGFLLLLVCFPLSQHHLQRYQETGQLPTSPAELLEWLRFLRPRPGFQLTPLVVGWNLAVFFSMVAAGLGFFEFEAADLKRWGAGFGPATRAGEWWRLLTSTFLHGGVLHLLNNMWALAFAGWALERVAGTRRLTLVYFVAALAGSLVSLAWRPDGLSVGASGAIMGLYGFGLVITWRTKGQLPVEAEVFRTVAGAFVVITLLLGLASLRVDAAAHLGGLGAGLLLGAALRHHIVPAPATH